MLSSEDLKAIAGLLQPVKDEVQGLKNEVRGIKDETQGIKERMKALELHIENYTDKSVQLLAENFIELTKKLNQAIPAVDNNRAYEVKVNYLIEKVQKLEKEVDELKRRTA